MSPPVKHHTVVSPHSMNVTAGHTRLAAEGYRRRLRGDQLKRHAVDVPHDEHVCRPDLRDLWKRLQLGNGTQNGSLGRGNVVVNTGGTSPIFNRNDTVSAPYVVSNTISGLSTSRWTSYPARWN